MEGFRLHPRLLADCHRLGRLSATHLLLHRNAAVPWFILVPETRRADLLDLPEDQRDAVLTDCKRIAEHLRGHWACPRVNVAWIGNVVAQLHVHVVGRAPSDPCWPLPVWGHLTTTRDYGPAEVEAIRHILLGR